MMSFSETLKYDGQGLIPAIAQDAENGEVLMMAWMNAEAVERTLATRRATYWSRSRQEFWVKGETSGHVQHIVDVRTDCDRDVILLKVRQKGAACHEGFRSCFYRSVSPEGELQVVEERLVDPDAVYTR